MFMYATINTVLYSERNMLNKMLLEYLIRYNTVGSVLFPFLLVIFISFSFPLPAMSLAPVPSRSHVSSRFVRVDARELYEMLYVKRIFIYLFLVRESV